MSKQDSLLSAEKKILIHLLNYQTNDYHFRVPVAMTHKGIEEVVGIDSCYVYAPIKKLITEGYVEENKGRVKHGKKMKKYLLLTKKGKKYTNEIINKLSDLQITLIRPGG